MAIRQFLRSNFEFDYDKFSTLLYRAARTAFQNVQQRHPDEIFYTFALLASHDYTDLHIAANTDQVLTRTARKYLESDQKGFYNGLSLDDLRVVLRYSAADWIYWYSEEYFHFFERINFLLSAWEKALQEYHSRLVNKFGDDKADELIASLKEEFNRRFVETCLHVMQVLGREGVFGKGIARQKVVINFLRFDESDEEYLKCAKQLNPPEVYERYARELTAAYEISSDIASNFRDSVKREEP